MGCGNISAATTFLKIAILFLILVYVLHIAGFAVPKWSTLKLSAAVYGFGFDVSYHTGLWKDCGCASFLGSETCSCFAKVYIPGWLRAVQAMETLGFIGLQISVIVSLVILFSRQDKTIRMINIVLIACSGTLILVGVIIFGVENTEDFEELFAFVETLPVDFDAHATLSVGFILSTIAGMLSVVVCLPLLMKDYITPIQPCPIQVNPVPVQYTNQGHVAIPPPGQTHVVVNGSTYQPMGYGQPYTQGPTMYGPQGQPMQSSSAYPQPPKYSVQEFPQYESGPQYKS